MTPLDLFMFCVSIAAGLFVIAFAAIVAWFLFLIVRGAIEGSK